MDIIQTVLMALEVFAAISLIVLILLQQGKGADAGASFGGGSSGSVFGSVGASNFMSRTTAYLATLFIVCTILLAFVFSGGSKSNGSVLQGVLPTSVPSAAPAEAQVPVAVPSAVDGIPK